MANDGAPEDGRESAPLFEVGALVLLVASIVLGALAGRAKGMGLPRLVAEAGGGALLMLIAIAISQLFKAARNRRRIAIVAFFTLLAAVLVHAKTLVTLRSSAGARRESVLGGRVTTGWVVSHGVSFEAPPDWVEAKPPSAKTIAMFVSPDSTTDHPVALVTIEAFPTLYTSLEDATQQWASTWGGEVLDAETDLDGVPALRVRAVNEGLQARPVEGLVALRRGAVYLIVGAAVADRTCWRQVEAVRRSWNWLDE